MVTRNSTNKLEFDTQEWGATVSYFAINTGTALDNETNPGEAVEAIVELIAQRGTIMSLGAQAVGLFRVAIENNGWSDRHNLEIALRALGNTVGTNNYNMTDTTVTDFIF